MKRTVGALRQQALKLGIGLVGGDFAVLRKKFPVLLRNSLFLLLGNSSKKPHFY